MAPRPKFSEWRQSRPLQIDDIIRNYENGLMGVVRDPDSEAMLADDIRRSGNLPDADDVAHYYGFADSGKGKLCISFLAPAVLFPNCYPSAAQERGDCTRPDALVQMADGSQKRITDVRVDELVISAAGTQKRVTRRIEKSFLGAMTSVHVEGHDKPLKLTPDHRVIVLDSEFGEARWQKIVDLKSGQYLVRPRGMEHVPFRISSVDHQMCPETDTVFCLEVEEDHSFICDGYAISNCVSHGGAGASLITIANDIYRGRPDEKSGEIEGIPDGITTQGRKEGVVSSAYLWWTRRSGGDGWSCSTCVRMILRDGLLLMKPYPDLGIDLSDYSYSATNKYARSGPPDNILTEARKHPIRTATVINSDEALRDLIYQGFGVIDCGGEAWSRTRNEHGVSRRSGSWSHSMKVAGYDDRDVIKQIYGEPLLLEINNWGRWNSGPRDIYQSASMVPKALRKRWEEIDLVNPQTGNIMIPEGAWWYKKSEARNRYKCALSGATGWTATPDVLI